MSVRFVRLDGSEVHPGFINHRDLLHDEARIRQRRVPVAAVIMLVMFVTLSFDVESDWFARHRASRRGYPHGLIYDGDAHRQTLSNRLDDIQTKFGNASAPADGRQFDLSSAYSGKWCALRTSDEAQLFPNLFSTKCGSLALKVGLGSERRAEALAADATLVLQDDTKSHEVTVKLTGEYKHDREYVLLVGSMRDMFMRNRGRNATQGMSYSPYSTCKVSVFARVSEDGEEGADSGSSGVAAEEGGGAVSGRGQNYTRLHLDGFVESDNCGWRVSLNATSMNMDHTVAKVTNYCFMMTTVAILQLVCLVHQVQQAPNPGVSLLSLGLQAMIDAYLCLLHLTAGIVAESMFTALATAAFCEFVVFSMFEMRYLIACSHSRLGNQNSWFEAQADIGTIYGRFYGLLLLGIVVVYQLKDNYWILSMLLYSFWVPQIIRNAVHAHRQPLRPMYIIGMSICRLALPLYFFGCPYNFLKVPYNFRICIMLVLYVALQVGLLLLQYYRGSRYFIPKFMLPEQYNYYRKLTVAQVSDMKSKVEEEGGIDCVICMSPVDYNDPTKRMVTPCGHFFHPECLERWLKVKMECPTCRRPLPPSEF